jgi:3-oxoacyl-[acyl-carrier protein] reductase
MDLGINGRKAIVCASSQGLGLACATSLASEGCVIFINGRDETRLAQAVAQIEAASGAGVPVAADITYRGWARDADCNLPEPDILVNNNAGPPWRADGLGSRGMVSALGAHAGPIL